MGSGSMERRLMEIHLNGEDKTIPDGLTVMGLVRHLELEPGWVVVERNLEALDRTLWDSVPLTPGDQIELVRFMGGG